MTNLLKNSMYMTLSVLLVCAFGAQQRKQTVVIASSQSLSTVSENSNDDSQEPLSKSKHVNLALAEAGEEDLSESEGGDRKPFGYARDIFHRQQNSSISWINVSSFFPYSVVFSRPFSRAPPAAA